METNGAVEAQNNVTLTSTDHAVTTNGTVTAENNVNMEAKGNVETNGAVQAQNNVTLTSTDHAVTTNGTVMAVAGNIDANAKGNVTANNNLWAVQGTVSLTSDAGNVAVEKTGTAIAKNDVTLKAEAGSVAINGAVASTEQNVIATAKDTVTTAADVEANKDVTFTSTAGTITTDGAVTAENNVNMEAKGNVETNGAVQAQNNVTLTSTDYAVTTNGTVTAVAGNIDATAKGNVTANNNLSAEQGSISLTSDAGNVTVEKTGTAIAQNDVTLKAEAGSVAINGAVTSTEQNVIATAKDTVAINADVKANQNVTLTSAKEGITQAATAGIQAQTVTAVSAKTVDLKGTGNQFGAITVQSSDENAGIQGSVLVQDSTDKLEISIQPVVNGDIKVENSKPKGLLQVSSDLQAKGDGAGSKGDIALKSDGNMQTDKKLTAANNVALTSTTGDVSIRGDVSTGTQMAVWNEEMAELKGPYNSLVVTAGGAIHEAEGVKIDTPVVEAYSGNGVSMESKNNSFGIFLADALEGSTEINGSVKVATNYYKGEDDSVVTIGLGASVLGDAEFSNLNPNGGLGILVWHPEDNDRVIKVFGGNGAKGDLVLKASQDVGLLGDEYAAHDVVVKSTNGSFYGIGKGIAAGNDVNVSVGDAVYYIGGTDKALYAGHDIIIETNNPTSDDAGIYIGALPDNINLMDVMNGTASVEEAPTKLWAGNNAEMATLIWKEM